MWSLAIIIIILLVLFLINHIIEYRELKFDNICLNDQANEIRDKFELYRSFFGCEEFQNLRKQNSDLLMENLYLKSLVDTYQEVYGNKSHSENSHSIPQGTIEAVKYAMKKSHPDSGGNAEDFIKFRKVYEELTRK